MKAQNGFSLAEVLISLFLASLILSTLTQYYLSSKRHYLEAQKIVSDHFDIQWVSDLLSDSIRRAGFTPCINIDKLRFKNPQLHAIILDKALIEVNRMSEHFFEVLDLPNRSQVVLPASAVINPSKKIIIADCTHAEVHEIADVEKNAFKSQVTLSKPLLFHYKNPIYFAQWLEEKWFIRPNSKKIPALYYQLVRAEELTPLIHSLSVEKENSLVKVLLGLEGGKSRTLFVGMRTN
ncbi:MAG: prepilin-type N-terminal cleavage/methylation domain-containing protein [Legionella sp.]|jgi:prepilin-type N-terminal cleavage/methylation domain-containing protein